MSSNRLHVQVITFNCARQPVDVSRLGAEIFPSSHDSGAIKQADLLVISLQEIAPIAHSFLGGRFLLPYLSAVYKAVKARDTPDDPYQHVQTHNVGMTAIMVLAKSSVLPQIAGIQTAAVGLGVSEMGNKGAAGVRLEWKAGPGGKTRLVTFVAAHLAPHENGLGKRIKDWQNIVSRLMFTPVKRSVAKANRNTSESRDTEPLLNSQDGTQTSKPLPLFTKNNIIVIAGDLNFRTSEVAPDEDSYLEFPVSSEDYDEWFRRDQLAQVLQSGKAFQHMTEFPPKFPPTYKLKGLNPDQNNRPSRHTWAKHRFPSWCDRVLFSSDLRHEDVNFQLIRYESLSPQPTSDHAPVILEVSCEQSCSAWQDFGSDESPYPLDPDWRFRRDLGRNKEYFVGALAYFSTTWEGGGILLATVIGALGGYAALTMLLI